MKKLCILFEANYKDRKGLVNAVVSRAKYLSKIAQYGVDVICLQSYPAGLNALIRKRVQQRIDSTVIDGVTIHFLWYRRFLLDDVFSHRLHIRPILGGLSFNEFHERMKDYGFISVHGASRLTYKLKEIKGIPYSATWHGSDIHSQPYQAEYLKRLTTKILQKADMNFFVSNDLRLKAKSIAGEIPSEVSYNGVSDIFFRYNNEEREKLKTKYDVNGEKVVAFVGNLVPVKNVLSLPKIFAKVKTKFGGPIKFWIIGDGYQRSQLASLCEQSKVDCILWGNQTVESMPEFYNCIDALILPSRNEGLGMVLIEAISCGANAVGSKVGGIPEVIGDDNTFSLDDCFEEQISDRIVYMLTHHVEQEVGSKFSWNASVKKEDSVYRKYLK